MVIVGVYTPALAPTTDIDSRAETDTLIFPLSFTAVVSTLLQQVFAHFYIRCLHTVTADVYTP